MCNKLRSTAGSLSSPSRSHCGAGVECVSECERSHWLLLQGKEPNWACSSVNSPCGWHRNREAAVEFKLWGAFCSTHAENKVQAGAAAAVSPSSSRFVTWLIPNSPLFHSLRSERGDSCAGSWRPGSHTEVHTVSRIKAIDLSPEVAAPNH